MEALSLILFQTKKYLQHMLNSQEPVRMGWFFIIDQKLIKSIIIFRI